MLRYFRPPRDRGVTRVSNPNEDFTNDTSGQLDDAPRIGVVDSVSSYGRHISDPRHWYGFLGGGAWM